MEKMSSQLKKVSNKLNRGQFEGADLTAWTKLSIKMKSAASLCVSNSEKALLDLKTAMDGLGEKVKGEDVEVTKKRTTYQKEKAELDKTLAKCNLFIVSSDEVANFINEAEKYYVPINLLKRFFHCRSIRYLRNKVCLMLRIGLSYLSFSNKKIQVPQKHFRKQES